MLAFASTRACRASPRRAEGLPPRGFQVAIDRVAALGPDIREADRLQRPDDLAYREVSKRRAHAAGSRKEVTRGVAVTCPAGSSTSSRYSSTASARPARASCSPHQNPGAASKDHEPYR